MAAAATRSNGQAPSAAACAALLGNWRPHGAAADTLPLLSTAESIDLMHHAIVLRQLADGTNTSLAAWPRHKDAIGVLLTAAMLWTCSQSVS